MNFETEVIQCNVPVLVDFYGDHCPPCRILAPSLERLDREYNGSFKLVKINIQEEPVLASEYAVSAVPTLLFFKNGNLEKKHVGMISDFSLRKILDSLI